MKNAIYLLIGIGIIFLEASFFNRFEVFHISINILLIYVCILALFTGNDRAVFLAFLLGMSKDFLVERVIGLNALIFVLLAMGIGRVKGSIYKEKWVTPFFLIGISAFFYALISVLFYKIYLGISFSLVNSLKKVVLFMPVEIFAGLILYYPLKKTINLTEDRW